MGVQDGAVLSAELGQQGGVSHYPMGGYFMGGELPFPGRIQADMGDGSAVRGSVLGERLDLTRSP